MKREHNSDFEVKKPVFNRGKNRQFEMNNFLAVKFVCSLFVEKCFSDAKMTLSEIETSYGRGSLFDSPKAMSNFAEI